MPDNIIYECDMHSHSKLSDGADTYEELIDHALKRGLKVLAVTDHDVTPPDYIEYKGAAYPLELYAKDKGLCLIRGIEFSCNTEVEDVHIIALGCDFGHPLFMEQQAKTILSKIDGYRSLCEKLNAFNMPITWTEILENNQNPITESKVQKKIIFDLLARKGYTKDWREAKLLVQNTPCLQVKREKPDAAFIIRLIRQTGGISILAHPYLIQEKIPFNDTAISRNEYISYLILAGLDGIEASYTYDKTSYNGKLSPEEIELHIHSFYKDRVRIISGGSDYHHDSKRGILNQRELGERGISFEYMQQNPLLRQLLY